jgi:hypothetical protein
VKRLGQELGGAWKHGKAAFTIAPPQYERNSTQQHNVAICTLCAQAQDALSGMLLDLAVLEYPS